jgi:hypothetical protein
VKNVGQHLLSYIAVTFELPEEITFRQTASSAFINGIDITVSMNEKYGSISRMGEWLYGETTNIYSEHEADSKGQTSYLSKLLLCAATQH